MALIESNIENGVATITLNRPEKLNAFSGTMRDELLQRLVDAGKSPAGAIVITGAGRAFCAGGDVEFMADLQKRKDIDGFSQLLHAGRRIVTTIRNLPQIVIAGINGVAAGAGCNLALACDYRIASEQASLGETFVKIGLHPDWGGSWFLPKLVGPARAMEILMSGRMVPASEALQIGMVDRVVPAESLQQATVALAALLVSGPRETLRAIKKAVYVSATNDLEQQLDLETANQIEAFQSAESEAAIQQFLARRAR